jgi:protoheme IX farnesyltransferase
MIGVAVLPYALGLSGLIYLWGSLVLGIGMLVVAVIFTRQKSFLDARRLLKASVIYLPLLVVLMVLDRL